MRPEVRACDQCVDAPDFEPKVGCSGTTLLVQILLALDKNGRKLAPDTRGGGGGVGGGVED